jgi:hypothetical protein
VGYRTHPVAPAYCLALSTSHPPSAFILHRIVYLAAVGKGFNPPVHDKHTLPHLLHGKEQRVYGNSAYASQKDLIASKTSKTGDFTKQRTRYAGVVDEVLQGALPRTAVCKRTPHTRSLD